MRALVIGFTYMVEEARGKFYAMLEQDSHLEILIICPRRWPHPLYVIYPDPSSHPRLRVVCLNTLWAGKEGAHLYSPKLASTIRSFRPDIIQVDHGPTALSTFQVLLMQRLLAPQVRFLFFTWVNWWYEYPFPRGWIEQHILAHSHGAIAGNQEAANILRRKGFSKPIWVMPQRGVDPSRYKPVTNSKLKTQLHLNSVPVIGFVGRLVPEKGILTLLRAIAAFTSIRPKLLIVGDGPLREIVLERASELGIREQVVLVGAVPVTGVVDYLNCMDVLVLPSETTPYWREQFGHVLIEAMACEVPVVGSSCGAIPEVIGNAGVIFPEGNVEQLRTSLERILLDEDYRKDLGRRGRQRVLGKYTEARLGQKLLTAYQTLLGQTR